MHQVKNYISAIVRSIVRLLSFPEAKSMRRQLIDPKTNKWYELDDKNHVWVCSENHEVCIDITVNDQLLLEGEARELTRKVAELRKTLNLKPTDPL